MVTTETPSSVRDSALFGMLVVICVGSSIAGQMFFPGANSIPAAVRALLSCAGLVVLAIGSERLLKRQFGSAPTLGLAPSNRSVLGATFGSVGGLVLVAAVAAGFWLCVRYRFERTSMTLTQILPDVQTYLLSNIGEELVFRGYLLLVLARRFGLSVALFITAALFGLFHLPGLSGLAALKMIFTTGACSYLFAAAFLATGTIWAAIALHFVGNLVLHKITGLSNGTALLKPVLQDPYPTKFDPAFWVAFVVPLLLAWALFRFRTAGLTGVTEAARPTGLAKAQ